MDKNTLQVVAIKIDQLENDSKLKMAGNNCEESDSCKKSWNIIPDDLIPFLLMFTFLNYDLSVSPIDKLKIKESKSKESIIKAADYCARKYKQEQYDQQYFLRYCNQKLHEVV